MRRLSSFTLLVVLAVTCSSCRVQPLGASSVRVLYAADWSKGLSGWTSYLPSAWRSKGGQAETVGAAPWPTVLLAPWTPSTNRYAVEVKARASDVTLLGDVGLVVLAHRAVMKVSGARSGTVAGLFGGVERCCQSNEVSEALLTPIKIQDKSNVDYSMFGPAPPTFNPGAKWHTYRMEVDGKKVRFLIDGKLMGSATNAQPASSDRIGLFSNVDGFNLEPDYPTVTFSSFQVLDR